MRRVLKVGEALIAVIVIGVALALTIVTTSDLGRGRVRVLALDLLRGVVRGTVSVERIEGNVLSNFTLVGVSIQDSVGSPFIRVDRLSARVAVWPLLNQRLHLSQVTLVRPDITLEQAANGTWNYERIFPSEAGVGDSSSGFGDWIRLDEIVIREGSLTIERPWTPDDPRARNDPAFALQLANASRLRIEQRGDRFVQRTTLRHVGGVVSEAIIAHPEDRDIRLQVDSVSAIVAAFLPPEIDLRKASGTVRIGSDSTTVNGLSIALPDTRARGRVTIHAETGDAYATLDVKQLAFADVRALYPELPETGGGSLTVDLALRDAQPSEYVVRNAVLQTGNATIAGNLGLMVADSVVTFSNTGLRLVNLPSTLVERLVPGLTLPLSGSVSGNVQLSGPVDGMQVKVAADVAATGYSGFHVEIDGGVGIGTSIVADRLHVRAERVPLALARAFDVDQPVGGVVTVDGTLNGSTARRLSGVVTIVHTERGALSRATVRGTIAANDSMRMNLRTRLHAVSLGLVRHFADSLDIQGSVTGEVMVRGTPRDLQANVALLLPGGGKATGTGAFRQPVGDSAQYRAEVTLANVDPQAMIASLPAMIVDGTTTLSGRGVALATLQGDVRSRLALFMIDSAEIRDVVLEARAKEGILFVDSLWGATTFGDFAARGTLGLTADRDGRLTYNARVRDLAGLRRWIATGDTGRVAARPALAERAGQYRVRLDSLRTAARAQQDPAAALATAMQEGPLPRRVATASAPAPSIPRDSTAGSFTVEGEARGHVENAALKATLKTPGLVWNGNVLGAGTIRADWRGVFTTSDTVSIDGGVDSLRLAGFALDSTRFRGTYRHGAGDVALWLFPGDTAEYRLEMEFDVRTGAGELRLREISIRLDSTEWRSTRPSVVSWKGQGIRIDTLELRDRRANARLFVNGEMPDADPGRLEVVAEGVRMAPWLTIAQSDLKADGLLSASIAVSGTRTAPLVDGTVALTDVRYGGSPFPSISTTLQYAGRRLEIDAAIRNAKGDELARVTGTAPLDLALTDSVLERLPEGQLALRIVGDSIPLAPFAEITDGAVTEVRGAARGDVAIAGTWKVPSMSGPVGVDLDQVRLTATGVLMQSVIGRMHLSGDTLHIDTLTARSVGELAVSGTVVLAPIDRPALQLVLIASGRGARVLDDERGELFAVGTLRASGPIDSLSVTGGVSIVRGVILIPDPETFDVIDTEDPAIFALADTAAARELGIAAASAITRNLRLDMAVDVRRGTFGRSADANVEVFGTLRVRTEPPLDAYLVTGSLQSDRGDYTIYGKRFAVTRGSVRFIGGETINPSLQLLASYNVQQAGRAPLDIRVVIGGTLDKPTLTLQSDAQPTLSQSDLISFLAFGRSSSSLLQFSGTGLEGGGAGGSSLAGNVAALATRQLASIGIGALVNEARSDLAAATGADVLNITPAQLPADVTLGALETVLRGTEIEFGRYLNSRTFVLGRVRPSFTLPGAFVEHRFNERLRASASLETRLQASTPSLSRGVEPRTLQVIGALLRWTLTW